MRKLKLQMQMTLDGFVARPDGQLDWMWYSGVPDDAGLHKVIELADTCDTILLGRKMTRTFIDHWENIMDNMPGSREHPLAQRMVNMHKIVFSHTEKTIAGRNLEVENGDMVAAINALKNQPGKDMMVYGGAGFVTSLINADLIDEYYIFRNPVAIGKGLSVFTGDKMLQLESSVSFDSGKVLSKYVPIRQN